MTDNVIESARTANGKIVKITIDEYPSDPFNDWDKFSHLVAWHSRYEFGNKTDIEQWKHQEDFEQWVKEQHGKILIMPLYLYNHSGISLSVEYTYPYNDRWGAGQIGYAYATYQEIRENYLIKRITKKTIKKAIELIKAEIEAYNQYLSGNVYQAEIYTVEKCDKGHTHIDIEDSISSIYGDLEDIKKTLPDYFGNEVKNLDWQNGDIDID